LLSSRKSTKILEFTLYRVFDAQEGGSVVETASTPTKGGKNMKPLPTACLHRDRGGALRGIFSVLVILIALHPSVSSADMVMHERTVLVGAPTMQAEMAVSQKSRESTIYLKGKRIRTETEGRTWILDFERGLLITIKPTDKTYTEISLKDLKEAQKQAMEWMKSLRAQMEEKMKTMTPEARAAMQKKLDSLPAGTFGEEKRGKISVKATGKKETINGFACEEYEAYEDGELTTRYWLAPSVSTKAFDEYQKELSHWLEGTGPLAANRLREWEHVRDHGFPIKVNRVKPDQGKLSFDREILRIEEKSLEQALFLPPKDYKRTEAPAFPKMGAKPGKMPPPK
jgi:hypothetical protein